MSKTSIGMTKGLRNEGLVISCRRASNKAILSIKVENKTDHTLSSLDLVLVCEYELDGEVHRKTKMLCLYSSGEQKCVPIRDLLPNESATYVLLSSHDTADLQSLAAAVSSDQYYISIIANHEEVDRVPGRLFGSILAGDR
jgi:hypothetical protein